MRLQYEYHLSIWSVNFEQITLIILTLFSPPTVFTKGYSLNFTSNIKRQPHKMVKHTQTIRWFVVLALKGLSEVSRGVSSNTLYRADVY